MHPYVRYIRVVKNTNSQKNTMNSCTEVQKEKILHSVIISSSTTPASLFECFFITTLGFCILDRVGDLKPEAHRCVHLKCLSSAENRRTKSLLFHKIFAALRELNTNTHNYLRTAKT